MPTIALSDPAAEIESDVPSGFERLSRISPMTNPWMPIYVMRTPEGIALAIRTAPPHTNARGGVHGGVISALADNSMGYSCVEQMREMASLVTVHLSVDYLDAVGIGKWLQFSASPIKIGKTLCVAQCTITRNGDLIAQASATFRVVAS